jgi:alanine racemase
VFTFIKTFGHGKADVYGHSAENIFRLLQPSDGVAVARFDEAIKLREKF